MVAPAGAAAYTPNLVPQAQLDGDPNQQLIDLQRYLSEEFERIQTALAFVPVQAAYAALLVAPGPAPDQPLPKGAPTPLGGFNNFSPEVPNRVTAVIGAVDSLQVEESGVFWVQAQITATVESGTSYVITIAINGVLSDAFGAVDAGNQTTFVTLNFYGLSALKAGDIVTLVAVATAGPPGPFTFIMESATFSAVRVSELHKGD